MKRAPIDPEILAALRALGVTTGLPTSAPQRRAAPVGARIELRYVLESRAREPRPELAVWKRRVPPEPDTPEPWELAPIGPKSIARLGDAQDSEILLALVDIESRSASRKVSAEDAPSSRFALSHAAAIEILPRVAASGRMHARIAGLGASESKPVVWRPSPWTFRIRVTVEAPRDGGSGNSAPEPPAWEVRGVLRADGVEIPLSAIDAHLDAGFVLAGGVFAFLDDGGSPSWLEMLGTHGMMRVTESRRAAFLEEMYAVADPPVDLPTGALRVEAPRSMTPHLVVRPPESAAPNAALRADLAFDYDGCRVASRRPGAIVFHAAEGRLLRRDPAREAQAERRLPPRPLGSSDPLTIPASRLAALVSELIADGWHVEAQGRRQRRMSASTLGVKSGVNWFDVEGEVRFDGVAVALPRVLEALRRGDDTVVLDDGSAGVLPDAWLARHGIVLRLARAEGSSLRFAHAQIPLLAALAEAEPTLRTDAAFDSARARLFADRESATAATPAAFKGVLRPYQLAGVGFLHAAQASSLGALLADEMGLGKTIQVLAYLAGREASGPVLVVAPRSLLFNWRREVERFTPSLRLLDHTGADRRPPGAHLAGYDVVLTTYGTLRRDAAALAAIDFDVVILDEAQAIKNDTSETSSVARRLRARHRVALTGTPVENHLGELGSIVEFLNPGLFGRASSWKATADATRTDVGVRFVARAIQPFFLRRTKAEVAPDLPGRLEETWMVELADDERKLYEELRARFRSELLGNADASSAKSNRSARVLEALLRLRQAACHPGLLDPARRGVPSTKVKTLLAELVTLRESGQKALVFSQFRTLLDLVKPSLQAAGIPFAELDGRTRDREATVARFQNNADCAVMLVSLKAGGVGLNLTAAEYVFLLDPWWNPAAEAQAIDRAHRIGQTKPVFAYRVIARGTVEERIAELQQRKRLLADSVLRGEGAALADLSREDLDRLLS